MKNLIPSTAFYVILFLLCCLNDAHAYYNTDNGNWPNRDPIGDLAFVNKSTAHNPVRKILLDLSNDYRKKHLNRIYGGKRRIMDIENLDSMPSKYLEKVYSELSASRLYVMVDNDSVNTYDHLGLIPFNPAISPKKCCLDACNAAFLAREIRCFLLPVDEMEDCWFLNDATHKRCKKACEKLWF